MTPAELKRRATEADTEMQQFYNGLTAPATEESHKDENEPRTKWAKQQGKGPKWDKWDNNWKTESSDAPTKKEFDQLKELVELMGRALIRHEDELSMRRTESDFILHMDTAEAGILGLFWTASQRWHKMKTEGTLTQSLRLTLFSVLVQEWIARFTKATQDESKQEQMAKMEWVEKVDKAVSWKYLRWNPESSKLEAVTGVEPISHAEALQLLNELKTALLTPGVILRFHGTRPLSKTYQSASLAFLLTVTSRSEQARTVHKVLTRLSGSSLTRLLGLSLRPQRGDRQPLLKVLAERVPKPALANKP